MSDVIGMKGDVTGGVENSIAMIDIPQDGFIIVVDWDSNFTLDAANEFIEIELSFITTNQLATNDVRGRISSISAQAEVLSAVGLHSFSLQKVVSGFDIRVAAGERLFLHSNATAGVQGSARCNLYVDFNTALTRRSARRR